MKERDSLTVTSLLEKRLKLRNRLVWAKDPGLITVVVNGTEHMRAEDMSEGARNMAVAAATSVMQGRLDENTAALAELGVVIEEDDE